jgi:hypothetical protein
LPEAQSLAETAVMQQQAPESAIWRVK